MYIRLKCVAMTETVAYWRSLLAVFDAWAGRRADLATWLGIQPADLDTVPSAYWISALYALLDWTRINKARSRDEPWLAAHWDRNCPETYAAIQALPPTG